MWSLVTGERASLPERIPDEMETRGEGGAGGSKVPAGVQQYGASGSNAWEAGGGRLAKQPRSIKTEDRDGVTVFRMLTVPILHLRWECNTREQGHQGNYFTDSLKLATVR